MSRRKVEPAFNILTGQREVEIMNSAVELQEKTPEQSLLPPQWRTAFERDAERGVDYADPRPERNASRLLAAFVVSGLAFLALPGTLLGVWNLISIASQHASTGASAAWIQAHGQAQLFGWVGSFILGISIYVLPKFRGGPLKRFKLGWTIWVLWTLGAACRWWVGVSAQAWRAGMIGAALMELAAYFLFLYVLFFSSARKKPRPSGLPMDLGSWLGIAGFAALGLALCVNLSISLSVALRASQPLYPPTADRAFLLIALWGFTVPVAWGYCTRFVTVFLGLSPPAHRAGRWLALGVLAEVLLAVAHQFFFADLTAVALVICAIWALRIFRSANRAAKITGVYRRFPAFVRLSFLWLVVGSLLGVLADVAPRFTGLGGASRHAVTVGFIATLIFSLGPRILPAFMNGRELYSARLMALSLWLLNLGCLARVSSEAVAYSAGGWIWTILPFSAFLELAAVIVFVFNLALTLSQPMPAWFFPDSITVRLPLYWYVNSFPKTREVLRKAGLKTLDVTGEVPRSLTLEEAAEADGADLAALLAGLEGFFRGRQPKRAV
jgi:NnrS protein